MELQPTIKAEEATAAEVVPTVEIVILYEDEQNGEIKEDKVEVERESLVPKSVSFAALIRWDDARPSDSPLKGRLEVGPLEVERMLTKQFLQQIEEHKPGRRYDPANAMEKTFNKRWIEIWRQKYQLAHMWFFEDYMDHAASLFHGYREVQEA